MSNLFFRHRVLSAEQRLFPSAGKIIFLLVPLLIALIVLPFAHPCASGGAEAANSSAQTLGDLAVGDRVVDYSWQWQFRSGNDYTVRAGDENVPVTWIVVAKNHYGAGSGVTLLAERPIGRHAFDNSSATDNRNSSNHWGDSGTGDADRGLRPWLNASGAHAGGGFYSAFSASFKGDLVTVTVPNSSAGSGGAISASELDVQVTTILPGVFNVSITYAKARESLDNITTASIITLTVLGKDNIDLAYNEVQNAFFKAAVQGYSADEIEGALVGTGGPSAYTTKDLVFIPSATELGAVGADYGPAIGKVFPYFSGADNAKRKVTFYGENPWYWTRSPQPEQTDRLITVGSGGGFAAHRSPLSEGAVRPLVNLGSQVPVSSERNADGVFEIRPEAVPQHTVTLGVRPGGTGSVEGAGQYPRGASVTASATAAAGYEFVSWTEGNNLVSLTALYRFTIVGDRNLVANFREEGDPADPNDRIRGDINNDGKVNVLDVILVMRHILELEALPADGQEAADLNNDGDIDVIDVSLLMRIALEF